MKQEPMASVVAGVVDPGGLVRRSIRNGLSGVTDPGYINRV